MKRPVRLNQRSATRASLRLLLQSLLLLVVVGLLASTHGAFAQGERPDAPTSLAVAGSDSDGELAVAAGVVGDIPPAEGQGQVVPTSNIEVKEGSQFGEVIISWDAVPRATHYRIGYVNMEVDYHFATASCTEEWIEAFVYVDVNAQNISVNDGRAEYTARRVDTGARHAFTVLVSNDFVDTGGGGSVTSEFFWPPIGSRWTFLPGRDSLPPGVTIPTPDCSVPAATPGQVPPAANITVRTGSQPGEMIISWDAVAQATHYRIGYVNMEIDYHFAKASCTGEWIEAFVYVDVNARNIPVNGGRAEYTVRRVDTGARHAFTVLVSNDFVDTGGGGSVSSEFFWPPQGSRWTFLPGRDSLPPGVTIPTPDCSAAPEIASPATDREALVALYNATGGANWTNNAGWLSDAPMGEWHGVMTDDDGRISSLELQQNNLSGQIPASLGNLSRLERLVLWENQLTGPIPAELGNLSNVRTFYLYKNQLTGPMPPSLGNLTNVERFSVRNNQLSGEIPSWLGNLTKVKWLRLERNKFTGPIPATLGHLSNATILALSGNQLTGPIPNWLGDMASLETLALDGNMLSGEIPVSLANLVNLQRLYLSGNQLTGCIPAALHAVATNDFAALGLQFCGDTTSAATDREALVELYNATGGPNWTNRSGWMSNEPIGQWHGVRTNSDGRVTRIDLRKNGLNGTIPATLGNLSDLNLINFGGNDLSGQIPPQLQNLSALKELHLWQNRLSGPVPSWLGNLGNLTLIYVHSNQFSGPIPSELGNLSNLARLELNDNQLSGNIPASLGNLRSLERLRLAGNELTGCIPHALLSVQENDLLGLVLRTCGSPQSESDEVRQFHDSEITYLKWEVGPGVPDMHYSLIREGVLHLHRYATPLGLPPFSDDSTIYLYRDLELMAQTLARLQDRSLESARESINSGRWGGQAGLEDEDSGWVMLKLLATSRRGSTALVGLAAHEFSHVYQYTLQKHGRFSTTHSEVRVIGPAWMQEGVAEFLKWAALAKGGEWTYEQRREDVVGLARRVDVTLKEMETYNGVRGGTGRYDLAALAAELLAAESSEAALIEYWTLLEPGTTWQEAFEEAFGLTIDEFYTRFARHRTDGFPIVDLN